MQHPTRGGGGFCVKAPLVNRKGISPSPLSSSLGMNACSTPPPSPSPPSSSRTGNQKQSVTPSSSPSAQIEPQSMLLSSSPNTRSFGGVGGIGGCSLGHSSSFKGNNHSLNSSFHGGTWDWDRNLSFTAAEGAGISASEEAGYTFGSHENGVRGKAGTPGFWAPEMLYYERDGKGKRYGPAADWWSFGCLAYALLSSRGPFTVAGGDTADDNTATLQNEPDLSSNKVFSSEAADLISKLLIKDPRLRLGSGPGGAEDIMAHAFFKGINWDAILQKRVMPPFKPTFNVLEMTKPVRSWSEKDKAKLAGVTLTAADQARYVGVPFSSQVSVYKAIVQNMALREYIEAELGEAIEPREGRGGSNGGGGGGNSMSSSGHNINIGSSANAIASSEKSGGSARSLAGATTMTTTTGAGGSGVIASASVHRSGVGGVNSLRSGGTVGGTTSPTVNNTTKRQQRQSRGALPVTGVTTVLENNVHSVSQKHLINGKRGCIIS